MHDGRGHARLPPGRLHSPVSPGPSSARWRPAAPPVPDSRASGSSGSFLRPFTGGRSLTVLPRLVLGSRGLFRAGAVRGPLRARSTCRFEALALEPVSWGDSPLHPALLQPLQCGMCSLLSDGAFTLLHGERPRTGRFSPEARYMWFPSASPTAALTRPAGVPTAGVPTASTYLLLPVQWEHSLATPPSSALWPSALFKLASSDVSSVVTTFPASVNANPLGPAPCSVSRCQPVHVTIKATLSPRSSSPKPPHQHAPTVGATAVHLEDGQALALLLPAGAPPFSRAPTRSQVPVLSRTWTCTLRPSVLHLHLA